MFAGFVNGCQPLFRMAKNFLCCSHCKVWGDSFQWLQMWKGKRGGGTLKDSTESDWKVE